MLARTIPFYGSFLVHIKGGNKEMEQIILEQVQQVLMEQCR